MKPTAVMATSQPRDWIEKFKAQASLEGMSLSQWVGEACVNLLEYQGGDVEALSRRNPQGGQSAEAKGVQPC